MTEKIICKTKLFELMASLAAEFRLFAPAEAAIILGVNKETLSQWRWRGVGPKFVKIGRNVKYRGADLKYHINNNTFNSTTQAQNKK